MELARLQREMDHKTAEFEHYKFKADADKVQKCKGMDSDLAMVRNDQSVKKAIEYQKIQVATDESKWIM